MCCFIDKEYTDRRIAQLKKHTMYITGYKILNSIGTARTTKYKYSPGTHELDNKLTYNDYRIGSPRGFHFYTLKKEAEKKVHNKYHRLIKVFVPTRDIIGFETKGSLVKNHRLPRPTSQAVSNSIFIPKEEWIKAGFKISRKIEEKNDYL